MHVKFYFVAFILIKLWEHELASAFRLTFNALLCVMIWVGCRHTPVVPNRVVPRGQPSSYARPRSGHVTEPESNQ